MRSSRQFHFVKSTPGSLGFLRMLSSVYGFQLYEGHLVGQCGTVGMSAPKAHEGVHGALSLDERFLCRASVCCASTCA